MSLTDRILGVLKSTFLLESRIDNLDDEVKRLSATSYDMDKRVYRIETMIEMGFKAQQFPRVED